MIKNKCRDNTIVPDELEYILKYIVGAYSIKELRKFFYLLNKAILQKEKDEHIELVNYDI